MATRKPAKKDAAISMRKVHDRVSNELDRELTENISLPQDFAIAIQTDRSLFLDLIDRPLAATETRMVAKAMGVLLDTNRKQAEKIAALKDRLDAIIDETTDIMNGLTVAMGEVRSARGYADGTKSVG
jgi:hypothetical protein